VLRGVDAKIPHARITAVVGPNGAGKTTLLRLMLGVLAPTAGRVTLQLPTGREEIASMPPRRRAGRIAYVPQQPGAGEAFSVEQIVRMGRLSRSSVPGAVDDALELLSIGDLRREPFATLSAGQQQRVALARAVAQLMGDDVPAPHQAILADEPCSAMDPNHMVRAMDVLRRQARAGRAVVLVLHDLAAALRFADDALLLDSRGNLAAHGRVAEVLTPGMLANVYAVGFQRFTSPDRPDEAILVPEPPPRE
jgi:iron complex transport system ATP-binding protein